MMTSNGWYKFASVQVQSTNKVTWVCCFSCGTWIDQTRTIRSNTDMIGPMTRSTELERVILQTLEEAGITGPPVILEHVLEHLGLSIFWDYKQAADRKTYLFPDPKGDGGWRIRLSPLLPRQRVPFDLAHECVEFLAMRRGIEGPHWQINRAAAELLLPTAWVEEVIALDGFDSVSYT